MINMKNYQPKKVEEKEISSYVHSSKNYIGYFAAIIAIDALGSGHIISTNPDDLFDTDLFDGTSLEDNIDGKIPELDPGIYQCQIKIHSYMNNIPMEAVEWDMNITLEDIKPIEIKL